ncbi:MAG: hypothetical protein ABSB94_10710 [Syntrophorhabdales bacterium]
MTVMISRWATGWGDEGETREAVCPVFFVFELKVIYLFTVVPIVPSIVQGSFPS